MKSLLLFDMFLKYENYIPISMFPKILYFSSTWSSFMCNIPCNMLSKVGALRTDHKTVGVAVVFISRSAGVPYCFSAVQYNLFFFVLCPRLSLCRVGERSVVGECFHSVYATSYFSRKICGMVKYCYQKRIKLIFEHHSPKLLLHRSYLTQHKLGD